VFLKQSNYTTRRAQQIADEKVGIGMSNSVLSAGWAYYGQGSFWVLNNVWGAGSLVDGVNYTQTIAYNSSSFPNGVTMSWDWPMGSSVLGYPEIVYGTQDGTNAAPAGVTTPPPTQVANFTNLSAQYSFSISGQTNNFDVGFDLWLTSQPNGGIADEIMVLVHNPWSTPGNNIGNIDNSGIYVSTNWGDGSANWTFVELAPTADQLSGTISFSNIMKTLVWDGVIAGSEYISGIELGAEVGGGTGSLTINSLSYQWNANPTVSLAAGQNKYSIASPGGNDIVGNGGVDTVVYQGAYSQYQIKQSGTETLIQQSGNISTVDVLNGIAFIQFSNGTYDVATSAFTSNAVGPTISSVAASGSGITNGAGDFNAGHTVTLTLTMNEVVTVAGGTPTLALNDGGTATYVGGSGTNELTFSYTVATGQNTPDLAVTAVNLGSATITDAAGNAANLAGAVTSLSGTLQIDTTPPAAPVITGDVVNGNNSVTLSGTAVASSTVTVYDGSTVLGTTAANSSGVWSYTTGALANGTVVFTATATDAAGNTSAVSAAVDPTIDAITGTLSGTLSGTTTVADGASILISGTVNNRGTILVNGGTLDVTGKLSGGVTDISGAGTVTLAQSSSENVTFIGSAAGKLTLDQATSYTGQISGFGTTQSVDLADINFSAGVTMSYASTNRFNTSGVLAITEGANTVRLQIEGMHSLANFSVASDGNGGTLLTDPSVVRQQGNAAATIDNNTVLEIDSSDSGNVTFAENNGILWLDQPSTFTGQVSGLGAQNAIDLTSIAFGAAATLGYSPNDNNTGGTLTVTNGSQQANIALLGSYMASSFVMESDNHGGTMILADAGQTANQSMITNPQHS
jgi:hypothetical protein